ncbi:MAG: response regulator [Bacteroidales bacterium]|nr:response regulator [Bacteroidales bacterium]
MMDEKITILYVDDESVNLKLFEINFKKKFNVLTAESGAEGLEQLKVNPHTIVVISDMKMPGMNGIDFIRLAKKDFPHIRFFILTGFDITEEIADALNERLIHKYFRKPFNMKEIEDSILEFL